MKKLVYLLICCTTLCACKSQLQGDIQGVWMGAYEIEYSGEENKAHYHSMNRLIDIRDDSLTLKFFIPDVEEYQYTYAFERKGKNILIQTPDQVDTAKIKLISPDSLVINRPGYVKRDWVFKRIDLANLPDNAQLEQGAYALQSPNYTDTLDFINETAVLYLNYQDNLPYIRTWTIQSYKNLRFVVIDNIQMLPLLIRSVKENTIHLEGYYREILNVSLQKMQTTVFPTEWLLGVWTETNRSLVPPATLSGAPPPPPPPPPPPYPEGVDSKLHLAMSKDSLTLRQANFEDTFAWKPNSTQEFICFFPPKGSVQAWPIVSLSKEKLVLKKVKKLGLVDAYTEFIEFEKTK